MVALKCDFCGNEAPKYKIKYIPIDNKNVKVMCFKCVKIQQGNNIKEKKSIKSLTYYSCKRCDYDFRHDSLTHHFLKCPYCGKKDQLEKKGISKII